MIDPIYLDHNATTPILPEVAEAIYEASLRFGANPESQHAAGRKARRALEESREQIGHLLGAQMSGSTPDQVLYTSGGTESNNLAIFGMTQKTPTGHMLLSAIEHPCIAEAAQQLKAKGWEVDSVRPNSDGIVQAESYAELLKPETRLASLMLANNETGVIQPVGKVAALCADKEIPIHTDASQAVGKIPVDFTELNVSALSCTAHKFHGPLGIGVLLLRHEINLSPMFHGGHQQAGLRPGTESVALAVGMSKALECWQRDAEARSQQITKLRDQFEKSILDEIPEAQVLGSNVQRIPNTSNISFVGFDRQALMMAFDQQELACSTGSACASGSSEPSPTLLAMGLEEALIRGSIRFSFGATTTVSEIEQAVSRILKICKSLRSASNC